MSAPLPSLRDLTRALRATHEAFAHPIAGGEFVSFVNAGEAGWILECAEHPDAVAREWVPGDGADFDAVAVARRLLAAARDSLRPARTSCRPAWAYQVES